MIQVTAAVIENNGRILIAKRRKDDPLRDKWEFPGGKIEAGETPEECLMRELREELGIEAKVVEFVCSSRYDYSHVSIELLAYRVRHVSGEYVPRDHEEVRWVTREELFQYDFPEADIPVIKKITGIDAG